MGKLPGRRKTAPNVTEAQKQAEADFYRCPKGHVLPNRTAKGQCTPIRCASGAKVTALSATDAAEGPPSAGATKSSKPRRSPEEELEAEEQGEITRLERARRRELARLSMLKVPEGLKGGDAEAWTAAKLVELSPLAAAEMELQLRFGDKEDRKAVAKLVLDATGHGKKDLATGGATIIINASGGINLPWRKAPERLVEGTKVVEVQPIGALQGVKK